MYAENNKHKIMVSQTSQTGEVSTPIGTTTSVISPDLESRETLNEQSSDNKSYHADNLRTTLINVGRKLLAEEGLSQLSLRKVAKLAGVSHTAPYRHFCDKSELLVSIALKDFEILHNCLERAKKAFEGHPAMQLKAAGNAYIQMFLKHPEETELMFGGTLRGATGFEDIEIYSRKCLAVLEEIIEKGQSKGIFDKNRRTSDLAIAAWSIVHGLAMLRAGNQLTSIYSSEEEIEEVGEYIAGILFAGMSAPDSK
jgi:AcrR family transcriptional regulator